jgi:hypothetical protein
MPYHPRVENSSHAVRLRIVGLVAIALAATLAFVRMSPPRATPRDAPSDTFSAERALGHVRVIATHPRTLGSRAHEEARRYILRTLDALGVPATVQETASAAAFGDAIGSANVHNVVGKIAGTDRTAKALLLVAHYDSVQESPGASDDGASVGVLLETARALRSSPPLRNDVWLLFSDAEELGLLGALAFVSQSPDASRVGATLNFDSRGSRGVATMFDVSADNGGLIEALSDAPYPVASSWVAALVRYLPNDTDLTPLKRAGLPGMAFAWAEGLEDYHHYTDSLATLSPDSVQHMGSYALSVSKTLATRDLANLRAPSVVYFDVLGAFLVHYSTFTSRLFAFLTSALLAALGVVAIRRKRATVRGIAAGAALPLAVAIAAILFPLATQGLLLRSFGFHAVAAHPFIGFAHQLAWTACIVTAACALGARRTSPQSIFLGAALLLTILLDLASIFSPGLTTLLEWPLALALAGASRWLVRDEDAAATRMIHAGLALSALLVVPIVYALVVAAGPGMVAIPIVVSAFFAMLAIPALAPWPATRIAYTCLAASVFSLAIATVLVRHSEQTVRTDSILYGLDTVDRKAVLLTYDSDPDPWVRARLGAPPSRGSTPFLFPTDTPFWYAAAPYLPVEPADVDVLSDSDALILRVRPHGTCFDLWQEDGPRVTLRSIDGHPVQAIVRFSPELDAKLARAVFGDTSRPVFRMAHCGAPPDGVTLVFAASGPVRLRIVERHPDLDLPPRPATTGPSQGSDVLLVSRTVVTRPR